MNPLEKQAIETIVACANIISDAEKAVSITAGMRLAFHQMKLTAEAARFARSQNAISEEDLERILSITKGSVEALKHEFGNDVPAISGVHLTLVPDAPNE